MFVHNICTLRLIRYIEPRVQVQTRVIYLGFLSLTHLPAGFTRQDVKTERGKLPLIVYLHELYG